jgi:hypothetical protein
MNLKNWIALGLLVISLYVLMAVLFIKNLNFYHDEGTIAFFIATGIIGIICFFMPKK